MELFIMRQCVLQTFSLDTVPSVIIKALSIPGFTCQCFTHGRVRECYLNCL